MTITLLLGPMYSGKSSELLRRMRRYNIAGKATFLIKYANDTRYETDCTRLSTHDQLKVPCEAACGGNLMNDANVMDKCKNVDVICVDEGQFFLDIVTFAECFANMGKNVIIAALDGTYQRRPFGKVLDLVCLAEEVVKLTAVCACGKDAAFTKRISADTEEVVVGGHDKYIATCRTCFHGQPPHPSSSNGTTNYRQSLKSVTMESANSNGKVSRRVL